MREAAGRSSHGAPRGLRLQGSRRLEPALRSARPTCSHRHCLPSAAFLAGVKCVMARRSQKAALTDMFAVYYSVNVMSLRCHKRSTPPGPRREVCGCFADVSASLGLAAVLDVSLTQKRLLRSDVAGFCRFLFFSLCLSPVGRAGSREGARRGVPSPSPQGRRWQPRAAGRCVWRRLSCNEPGQSLQ